MAAGARRAALPLPHACPRRPSCRRFWFRLYWFPLKVLYATSHCSLRAAPGIPFYFFFNALLLLLALMNLYWFLVSGRPPRRPALRGRGAAGPVPGEPCRRRLSPHRPSERATLGEGQRGRGRSRRRSRGAGLSSHLCLPLPQYIVAFAAKVLTGQVRELKDVREYDTAEAPSPKPRKAE